MIYGIAIQCLYQKLILFCTQTAPFLPPNEVHISSVYLEEDTVSGSITFNWSSVKDNCPALLYDLISINCGSCPDISINNEATCHNISVGNVCTFAVNTLACETIMGDPSSSVSITAILKGKQSGHVILSR